MKRAWSRITSLSLLVSLALTQTAYAEGRKILVLQSEGRVDAKTRARIDVAVVNLAKSGTDQVTPGEITYSDAAALVGCKPEEASCKDEVIQTLAVDEIVIVVVTPKPGGLEVSVRRVAKGAASREAVTIVSTDKPDKLDAVGTLFGRPGTAPTTTEPVTTPPTVGPEPTTEPTTKPVVTEPAPTVGSAELRDDRARKRRRLHLAGMGGGGGMFLIGILLWSKANGLQSEIDSAMPRNERELDQLRDLESRGASYAGWGNFFVLGGLALGGVSTYFFLKARRANKRAASTAWLGPALFDRGAGVMLTIGPSR